MVINFNIVFSIAVLVLAGDVIYLLYQMRAEGRRRNELYSILINNIRELDERLRGNISGVRSKVDANSAELDEMQRHYKYLCHQVDDVNIRFHAINVQMAQGESSWKQREEEHDKELESLRNQMDELNTVFNDLVQGYLAQETERESAEARAQEVWNEGLTGIINYGENIARLNKEVINGRQ